MTTEDAAVRSWRLYDRPVNHPLVRVRREGSAVSLDVAECNVHLSPSEALRLLDDLETLLRDWPAIP